MARKNVLKNWSMFGTTGADMSQSSVTSSTTEINYQDNAGIIVTWAGTSPVGQFFVDVSNDNTNWVTLDFGSAVSISGDSGSHAIDMTQLPFSYIRSRYVKTSGTGTLNANLTIKEIGG